MAELTHCRLACAVLCLRLRQSLLCTQTYACAQGCCGVLMRGLRQQRRERAATSALPTASALLKLRAAPSTRFCTY